MDLCFSGGNNFNEKWIRGLVSSATIYEIVCVFSWEINLWQNVLGT